MSDELTVVLTAIGTTVAILGTLFLPWLKSRLDLARWRQKKDDELEHLRSDTAQLKQQEIDHREIITELGALRSSVTQHGRDTTFLRESFQAFRDKMDPVPERLVRVETILAKTD